jgi:hypothetical protein
MCVTHYVDNQVNPSATPDLESTKEDLIPIDALLQRGQEGKRLVSPTLCRDAQIHNQLRQQIRRLQPGRRLDLKRAVHQIARGQPLRRIPYQTRPRWPHMLHIWCNTQRELTPLQPDYAQIQRQARQQLGTQRIRLTTFRRGSNTTHRNKPPPQSGDAILVLDERHTTHWVALSRTWQARHVPVYRLKIDGPAPGLYPIPPRMPHVSTFPATQITAQIERLLAVTSAALFVEPALLRTIRQLFPGISTAAEVGVWQHAAVCATHDGYYLRPDQAICYQQHFAELPDVIKQQIGKAILAHHTYWLTEPRHEEVHRLHQLGVPLPAAVIDACDHFFRQLYAHQQQGSAPAETKNWLTQTGHRQHWLLRTQTRPAYAHAYLTAHRDELRTHPERWPPGLSTDYWPLVHNQAYPPHDCWLVEDADGIRLQPDPQPGNPILQLQHDGNLYLTSTDATLPIQPIAPTVSPQALLLGHAKRLGSWVLHTASAKYTLDRIQRPVWAHQMGRDQSGLYADLVIADLTQRMRWINPGTHLIGSPPQKVRLNQGYWLTNSVCDQALWQHMLPKDDSNLPDNNPQNPAHWQINIRTLLQQLNAQVPGLAARLPTRVQHQYLYWNNTTNQLQLRSMQTLSAGFWFAVDQTSPDKTTR